MRKLTLLVGLVVLVGCKKEPPTSSTAPAASAEATTHSAVVADPLAAVKGKAVRDPAGLVSFELARIPAEKSERGTYVFVKPAGWEVSPYIVASVRPPASKQLGFRTSLTVTSDCDGFCAPKDWATLIEAKLKKSIEDSPTTHDETSPDGRRIRWQTIGKNAYFSAAWFTPGASFYYSCSGALEDERLLPYLDAFVEICRTAKVEK